MKRKNYKILIIFQVQEDLMLAKQRIKADYPNATITPIDSIEKLKSTVTHSSHDIAIMHSNIKWITYEKIVSYLSNITPAIPIFAFVERSQHELVRYLLNLGVKDYSLSNPKYSFRLPIAIKSIIETSRSNINSQAIQHRLEEQEVLFKTLFDNAPEAVAITDEKGFVTNINPMFTTIFGYLPSELIGKSIDEAICPKEDLEMGYQINQELKKVGT